MGTDTVDYTPMACWLYETDCAMIMTEMKYYNILI